MRICLAGATGNVGRQLVQAIEAADDLTLVAAVGRTSAGRRLGEVLPAVSGDALVHATIEEALAVPSDVVIDYTKPGVVAGHVKAAVAAGRHVVIGTSGLTDDDYRAVDAWARASGVGVFAAGNFSLTAALLQHFAAIAARYVPHWEVLDYASDAKPDAPSGTARELAFTLGQVGHPRYAVAPDAVQGAPASRGAALNGTQVHAVRVPGFYSSAEVVFGLPGERLSLRHDSISHAPYVGGTLLAARAVGGFVGLRRGLHTLLGLEAPPA